MYFAVVPILMKQCLAILDCAQWSLIIITAAMAFIFPYLFLVVLLGIVLAAIILSKIAFRYWKKRGVPVVTQPTILFGHSATILFDKTNPALMFKDNYTIAKALGKKHCGMFLCTQPEYVPVDLEYVKNILQRDFNCFTERGFYYNEKDDPLSANLVAIGGERWKNLRAKLSPAYTSGKLKVMFDGVLKCSSQMHSVIKEQCQSKQTINIKDISECYTVDVIGSCAFGLECNSFTNPEAEFIIKGRKTFDFPFSRLLKAMIAFGYPTIARRLGIALFDKDLNDFFKNVVRNSLEYRKTNGANRKDFLQVLLDLQENPESQEKPNFSLEEITAQVFIFFAAGFETSSITIAFALYEIATNVEIQEKLRREINAVLKLHKGNVTYDAVMDMKYLDQAVQETLRKYPPVSYITRVAVKDYRMPNTDVVIEKGIRANIPIFAIHHDPEFYPDPERFDPERFSEENKQKRLPFTYMPFGEGPRICIGLRFGLMQVKVGLVTLLRDFKFALNGKTQVPLEMAAFTFTLTPKNGIFLDVEKAC